jgi:hypothetical protein
LDARRKPKAPPGADQVQVYWEVCSEYIPLAYIIEAVVRSGSIYTVTARTGAGKTAFNVIAALAVATGRPDLIGRDVTQGRVAYLACENPDDIRMRFKIAAYLLNIDLEEMLDSILRTSRSAPRPNVKSISRSCGSLGTIRTEASGNGPMLSGAQRAASMAGCKS